MSANYKAPSLARSFSESFSLFLRHFPVLAGLFLSATVISALAALVLPLLLKNMASFDSASFTSVNYAQRMTWSITIIVQLLPYVLSTFAGALFCQYAAAAYLGDKFSWKAGLKIALRKLIFLLLAQIGIIAVLYVALIPATIVITIAAIIPGINIILIPIVVIALVFALLLVLSKISMISYAIILENKNPILAFTRSLKLTHQFTGRLMLFHLLYVLVVVIVFIAVYGVFLSSLFRTGIWDAPDLSSPFSSITIMIVPVFFMSWLETAKLTVFFQIKQFKESYGMEKLVMEFNAADEDDVRDEHIGN